MKVYLFLLMLFFCQIKAVAQVWIQFKGTTTDKMVLGKIYPQAYIRERFGETVSFSQEKSEEDDEDPYDFKNYGTGVYVSVIKASLYGKWQKKKGIML